MGSVHFFEKDDLDMPRTITKDISAEEILLVFADMDQASAFWDWWSEIGLDKFKEWVDKHEEEYM